MVLNQAGMIILYQVIMYKLLGGVINEVFSLGYTNVENFVAQSFWSQKRIKFLDNISNELEERKNSNER